MNNEQKTASSVVSSANGKSVSSAVQSITLPAAMNDIVSRFLANLPQSELSNWPRIFYQLEQV